MAVNLTVQDFILRITVAILAGLCIGTERQLTGHMAGIKVNILVSLSSCLFVLFGVIMKSGDVTRIAAQIVTGVGFLCSGIIMKDGINVRGLNTAATIWCMAAIGVLSSSGRYVFAITATLILLAVNIAFRFVCDRIQPLPRFCGTEIYYKISATCMDKEEMMVRSLIMNYLEQTKLTLIRLESDDVIGEKVEIEATLFCQGKRRDETAEKLITRLSVVEGVFGVGWELL